MRTAGLDIATTTGMALVGDGEDRGKIVHIAKERGFLRLQLIAQEVEHTFQTWLPTFVAVEDYAYVRNVGAFVTLVEVGTVVRMTLRKMGLPWVDVPPTVLKKWTTGKGNATKEQMAIAVQERWQYVSRSHDIVDAFALAQMAQLGLDAVLKVKGVEAGWTRQSGLLIH